MRITAAKCIAAALAILALLVIVQTISFLLGPFLNPRIEKNLSERLGAEVQIDGFVFGIMTGAHIETLHIRRASQHQTQSPLELTLFDTDINHSLLALLSGRYRVASIRVRDFDAAISTSTLQRISRFESKGQTPTAVPDIEVKSGRVRLDHKRFSKELIIEGFGFNLKSSGKNAFRGHAAFKAGGNNASFQFTGDWQSRIIESDIDIKGFDLSLLAGFQTGGEMILNPAMIDMKGHLNGSLSIKFSGDARGLNGDFTLLGLSVMHPDYPVQISNGSIGFHATSESVLIHDGAFTIAGGSAEIPSGGIHFSRDGIERIWLNIAANSLLLPEAKTMKPLDFLPSKFRPAIHTGSVDADANIQWTPEKGPHYAVDLTLQNASAYLPAFDDTIRSVDAEISISSPGRILIKRARGYLSGGRLTAAGSFAYRRNAVRDPFLDFQFSEIPQSDHLLALLPNDIQKIVHKIGLSDAQIEGEIRVDPEHYGIDIDIEAQNAALPDLPFQLNNPATTIKWTSGSEKVVFKNFRAFKAGSPIEGHGILHLGETINADFTLLGRYLPITPEILRWLDVDLQKWQVDGRYDMELRALHWWPAKTLTGSLKNLNAQLDLKNVSLTHPKYGRVAQNCYTNLTIDPQGALLSNFRGNIFGIGFNGSGVVPFNASEKSAAYRLESENIKLTGALFDRLPFGAFLEGLNLSGQCEIQAELTSAPGHPTPDTGEVTAVFHNINISPDETQINGSGTTRIMLSQMASKNTRIDGMVHFDDISAGVFEGDRLTADFNYQNNELKIPQLKMGAYGGKVAIDNFIMNTDDLSWETKTEIAYMDFESLVGTIGIAGREAPAGTLRGEMQLKGRKLDPSSFSGNGELKIDRGRLYNLPMLVSVFNVLNLELPRKSPVTDAYGIFSIKEGRITAEDLLFSGGAVPVHVEGTIALQKGVALADQPLELLVTVVKREGLLDQIPVVDWVKHYTLDYLRRLVFQATVQGTVTEYKVKSLSTPITMPIQRMWSLMNKITPSPTGN